METGVITFIKKPDWVSWDEIQRCHVIGHERNIKKGLKMQCAELTAEELKDELNGAICYVALDGKRVVGTTSLKILDVRKLWFKKRIGIMMMEAILPEYIGSDVFFGLQDIRMKDAVENNVEILYFGTAEANKVVRKVQSKLGFKQILFRSFPDTTYYSVMMAKWIKGKPLPDWLIKTLFYLSEKYVKFRYKPGKIKRFGI